MHARGAGNFPLIGAPSRVRAAWASLVKGLSHQISTATTPAKKITGLSQRE